MKKIMLLLGMCILLLPLTLAGVSIETFSYEQLSEDSVNILYNVSLEEGFYEVRHDYILDNNTLLGSVEQLTFNESTYYVVNITLTDLEEGSYNSRLNVFTENESYVFNNLFSVEVVNQNQFWVSEDFEVSTQNVLVLTLLTLILGFLIMYGLYSGLDYLINFSSLILTVIGFILFTNGWLPIMALTYVLIGILFLFIKE